MLINLLHLSLEISQCYVCQISFPMSLTCCLFVLAHMLPQLTLCSFGSHEPIHASGIGLLLEVLGILMSIEHLHHGKYCTHSGTRTICPLIPVSDQRIVVALCPYCCGWIHPRKSTSGTVGKLIPVLLTNLTHYLKGYYLGRLPRSSSFRFCLPFLLEGCLGMSWYGQPYFIP